jgi:hypothetical protein
MNDNKKEYIIELTNRELLPAVLNELARHDILFITERRGNGRPNLCAAQNCLRVDFDILHYAPKQVYLTHPHFRSLQTIPDTEWLEQMAVAQNGNLMLL